MNHQHAAEHWLKKAETVAQGVESGASAIPVAGLMAQFAQTRALLAMSQPKSAGWTTVVHEGE